MAENWTVCGQRKEHNHVTQNRDNKNRWRNKTVAFRVSPEEDEQIEAAVRLSGLTKQGTTSPGGSCAGTWVVQGQSQRYKALRNEMAAVLEELQRIEAGAAWTMNCWTLSNWIASIMGGMGRRIDRLMDDKKMKTTARFHLLAQMGDVAAHKNLTLSITERLCRKQSPEKDLDEMLRQMQRFSNDPAYLTISMNDPYENVYQSRPPVIDGLLYTGPYLFVERLHVGKSFLWHSLPTMSASASPCGATLSVRELSSIWRWRTTTGAAGQLYRMFGTEGTNNLYSSIHAKQLGGGLEEQLKGFVQEHLTPGLSSLILCKNPGGWRRQVQLWQRL